jgi:hypothetical protein
MKIAVPKEGGGVLLATLAVTVVLGTTLAAYLKLVQYQHHSVVRSQYWNAAIPSAEAGIEEALTHLNFIGDADRATNGWQMASGVYQMSRTLGDLRYDVSISGELQPTITSIGYVTEPLSRAEIKRTVRVETTRYGAGMRGIITRRGISMNGNTMIDSFDSEDPNFSTNGRYDSAKAKDNGFAGAVAGDIAAEGEGVYGFAATGPTGQANGNIGSRAWLASHTGIEPGRFAKDLNVAFTDVTVPFSGGGMTPQSDESVTVTNYTYLTTQLTTTTFPSPVPSGGVTTNFQRITTVTKPFSWSGTLVTNTASTTSTNYPTEGAYVGNVSTRVVVEGKGKKAVNVTYYDYMVISGYTYETTTYTYNLVTTNATTQTTTYSYVTGSGNYQVNGLSMSGHSDFLVAGDTVLYVNGDFSMSGQSTIHILPGASLKVYVNGNASLSGNGIMNLNEDASKFSLYGLPSCTSISLSGNAAFTGTIYAPSAALSLNGGGNNQYDIVGAVVADTASFHGHFAFHYDEKLGRNGGKPQFRIASWSEI